MELRQLEQFVAVAELGGFTRAAARLNVVQSGVSATIAGLEHELGARLFERGARAVRLTDAGSALLPAARATLDAAQSARDAVAQIASGVAGEVALGTMASIQVVDLPALLAGLRRDHPGILVRLRTSPIGSAGLIDDLGRGELDAALVANDGAAIPGLRLTRLLRVPIVALLPAEHRLAGQASVALADLAGERFIDFPPGFGNRRTVDAAFERLGLSRQVAVEVTDTSDAQAYVRQGLGVSLVPSINEPAADSEVVAVPVTAPALPWVLWMATSARRAPGAATLALLALVPAYLRTVDTLGTGSSTRSGPASPEDM